MPQTFVTYQIYLHTNPHVKILVDMFLTNPPLPQKKAEEDLRLIFQGWSKNKDLQILIFSQPRYEILKYYNSVQQFYPFLLVFYPDRDIKI